MRIGLQINIEFYSTFNNASKFATSAPPLCAFDLWVTMPHNFTRKVFWVKIIEFNILFLRVINRNKFFSISG
jgi:hypothetical protein